MDGMTLAAAVLGGLLGLSLLAIVVLAQRRDEGAVAKLEARLEALASGQMQTGHALSERLQTQERVLTEALDKRMADVARRLSEGLQKSTEDTSKMMTGVQERLAVIDRAQNTITTLSQQVVSLQDVLSNRHARGAFGEIQLNDLVTAALPPSAYAFQASLLNGKRVDCLLSLPNPPGSMGVDSKFPLDSYHALREAADDEARKLAARAFAQAVRQHVRDIAEKYIVPGETADSALMFLPSEAVYAELHANHPDVVRESFQRRVWIVSPTTMMATLNTVRAILRDAEMSKQAGLIQREVQTLLKDVERLDDRMGKLDRHFNNVQEDIRQARISVDKITKRASAIDEVQLEDAEPDPLIPGPAADRAVARHDDG